MQIKGCTRATRKLLVTTRICKCECEMHCFVACRMLESNTIGWSFCKNPPPLPGWVQLEFHLLHSQQEIMKILIMIFLGLLLCYFTSIFKNTISNVQRSFIPARASCCLVWYSSFRWRLARADVTTSTCQKECERLWLSFISDLKYVGETRYRISYHKIICTIQL